MNQAIKKRPVIAMDAVESSQIHSIGHHAETNTLAITFKSKSGPGSVYHYENFTAAQFADFKKAESTDAHSLADAEGSYVTIVIEERSKLLQEGDALTVEKDQKSMFDASKEEAEKPELEAA
jgi:hypothetical protein